MGSQMTAYFGVFIPTTTVYKSKTIRQFNKNTGKPYDKKVSDGFEVVFTGTDIKIDNDDVDEYYEYHLVGENKGYFGVTISSIDRDDDDPVIFSDIAEMVEDYNEMLLEVLGKLYNEKDVKTLMTKAKLMHMSQCR